MLEILKPVKRSMDLQKLMRKIDRRVKVQKMRLSNIAEVRQIKESRAEKTYRVLVVCDRKISKKDLNALKTLKQIKQKTPQRVLHRRGDRMRPRHVKQLKFRYINPRKFQLVIRAEAGLYIKELISGDEGRTQPNVSLLLGSQCKCKELDVVGIHTR